MANTLVSSGTLTATASEQSLGGEITSGKTHVIKVDTAAMVLGDVVIIRVKEKLLSGGTQRTLQSAFYKDVQACPIKISNPAASNVSFEATLVQPVGTFRTFPWTVLALD